MAAIEDDEEGATWRQCRHQCSVELVAIELSILFVVERYNSVVKPRIAIAIRISDLSTMTRVVEKVALKAKSRTVSTARRLESG